MNRKRLSPLALMIGMAAAVIPVETRKERFRRTVAEALRDYMQQHVGKFVLPTVPVDDLRPNVIGVDTITKEVQELLHDLVRKEGIDLPEAVAKGITARPDPDKPMSVMIDFSEAFRQYLRDADLL